jgi:hypothetical protein
MADDVPVLWLPPYQPLQPPTPEVVSSANAKQMPSGALEWLLVIALSVFAAICFLIVVAVVVVLL